MKMVIILVSSNHHPGFSQLSRRRIKGEAIKTIRGLTLVFVISFLLVPNVHAAHENAVDGDITYSNEWSDANSIDIVLGTNYGRSPPFLEPKLWVKNDATHIYFLVCIKFDYIKYDLSDKAYIYYLILDESRNIIPVGGTVEDIPEMEIIKPIILRILVCSAIIVLATLLARYIK